MLPKSFLFSFIFITIQPQRPEEGFKLVYNSFQVGQWIMIRYQQPHLCLSFQIKEGGYNVVLEMNDTVQAAFYNRRLTPVDDKSSPCFDSDPVPQIDTSKEITVYVTDNGTHWTWFSNGLSCIIEEHTRFSALQNIFADSCYGNNYSNVLDVKVCDA